MAYLIRRLGNLDAWAQAATSPMWGQEDCPSDLMRQIYDNSSGVSTWRIDDPSEAARAVAAQAFLRSAISDFAYCLIDEQDIRAQRIRMDASKPGKTVDKDTNKRHVELQNLTSKQVAALARIVCMQSTKYELKRMEILTIAATNFSNGNFDKNVLFERGPQNARREDDEIANSKNLLVSLWKKGDLKLDA
jgi:hypothetical protein